jgi:hypothetical protein
MVGRSLSGRYCMERYGRLMSYQSQNRCRKRSYDLRLVQLLYRRCKNGRTASHLAIQQSTTVQGMIKQAMLQSM